MGLIPKGLDEIQEEAEDFLMDLITPSGDDGLIQRKHVRLRQTQ